MRFINLKTGLLLAGLMVVAWGYHLLAVPPEADYAEMLRRAKGGVLSVVGGSGILITWLVKR